MGNPWTRKAAGISPSGDSHGASIHSDLPGRRHLSGCGSAPADTHTLEPVPQCSYSKPLSCSFLGMPFRKGPAPLGPRAAIFPQEGTLREDHPPAVCVSSGSSLDLQPPQVVPYLSPSHAASWRHNHPSARPLPLTLSNTGPDSSHPLTTPIHLTSVFPALCHILKVWPAPQKLRDSLLLLFALRAGPPSFSRQAGSESADPRVS